jgi:hypothetical protein
MTVLCFNPVGSAIRIAAIKPEHCGDWHDKPVRYSVTGPNAEVQKFSTKKEAERYARMRRRAESQNEAMNRYVRN